MKTLNELNCWEKLYNDVTHYSGGFKLIPHYVYNVNKNNRVWVIGWHEQFVLHKRIIDK